jgi:uncharacterized OB-fold protein
VSDLASGHGRVAPEIDPDSSWWWDTLAAGELTLPACHNCGRCFFPPMPGCPHCGSAELGRTTASGRGRIYSWVVIHQPLDPAFAGDVPATVVAVDLEEGARVAGRAEPGLVPEAGMPVEAFVYSVGDQALLGFRPAVP